MGRISKWAVRLLPTLALAVGLCPALAMADPADDAAGLAADQAAEAQMQADIESQQAQDQAASDALTAQTDLQAQAISSDGLWSYTYDSAAGSTAPATLSTYTGSETTVTIPSTVDGHPVTALRSYMSWGAKEGAITSITVPESITTIATGAFENLTGLQNVSLGGKTTTVGDHAFAGCTALTAINLPEGLTTIDESAFYLCTALKNVSLPSTLQTVSYYAFAYSGITSMVIPASVTSLGSGVFSECANLASVVLATSTTSIGQFCFYQNSKNSVVWCRTQAQATMLSNSNYILHYSYGTNVKVGAGFSDVKWGQWYTDSVLWASGRGVMSGYTGTDKFGPYENIERCQVAVIIYRYATGHTAANTDNNVSTQFSDVKSGQYYSAAVKWCADNGIVTGYSGTSKFGPHDQVTREQLATMLYRYAGYDNKSVTASDTNFNALGNHSKVSAFAKDAMVWATDRGILTGVGGTDLAPQDSAWRASMAKMMMTGASSI